MTEIINILKTFNCSAIQIIEEGYILIDDILREIDLKYFDIDDNLEKYKSLKSIAIIETSPLLKDNCFEIDIVYIYLFLDNINNLLYIGLDYLHPYYWDNIKINNLELIEKKISNIIEIYTSHIFYNNNSNNKFNNVIRKFIGTENSLQINFDEIENFIVENKFCEYFMWGSYWCEFPYRENILNKKYSKFQIERMMTHALKQDKTKISISTRTKASKSIIKFEYIKGAIILEIQYNNYNNKYNNNNLNYPIDMPLDLLGAICQFDLIDYKELLLIETLNINNISLSLELLNKNNMEEYLKILDEINKDNIDINIKNYINEISIIIKINQQINKLNFVDVENKIKEILEKDKNNFAEFLSWIKLEIKLENDNNETNNNIINNHLEKIYNDIIDKLTNNR